MVSIGVLSSESNPQHIHPTDVLDNLDIAERGFLQLQQLGRLHQVLELQDALRHVVALAPLLNPCDVVVDLQPSLPGQEVASQEKVVEGCNTYELQQFCHCLVDDGLLNVVCPHGLVNLVEQAQEVVHAELRLVVSHQKLGDEPIAIGGDESGKRLRFDDCWDDDLLQLFLQHLHPGVVDVVL